MTPNDERDIADLTFEDALAQLERIVRSLDAGQSSLETSLADYEKGVRLLRHCHATLQNAERRIEILKGVSADGTPVTEIADENSFSTDAAQPGRRRSRPAEPVRKKRVRKAAKEDDVTESVTDNRDEWNDIPFDFD